MKSIIVTMVAMAALIQAAPVPESIEGMNPSNPGATAKQLADEYMSRFGLPNGGMTAPQNRPQPNEEAKKKAKQEISGIGRTVKGLPNSTPIPIGGVGPTGIAADLVGKTLNA